MSLFEPVETSTGASDLAAIPASARRAAMLEHPTLAVAAIQKGQIRDTNGPWQALFALPPGVSVESHVATLFPNAGSADRFERTLQAELATAAGSATLTARAEHMMMRRDGSAFLAELVVRLYSEEDIDRPLNGDAVWQIRDITVERTLRRELRDLEDYHRELSLHQWDLTFVIDRKGRISYASSSIEIALGYRVHAMLGEAFGSLLDPLHAPEAEQWLRAATRQSASDALHANDGFPMRVLHADGGVRVLSCRPRDCFGIPLIAGMVVHARDITDAATDVADSAAREADATRLRSALLSLAGISRTTVEAGITSLLISIRTELDAAMVTLWTSTEADGARSWSVSESTRRDGVDGRPAPLHERDAGSPWRPLVRNEADGTDDGVGSTVEVPVVKDDRVAAWIAVSDIGARRWSNAEVEFVTGVASVVASLIAAAPTKVQVAEVLDPQSTAAPGLDALTGLPGRVAAERELVSRMIEDKGGSFVVLMIALDRLQEINDGLGLPVGDAVIVRTAQALRGVAAPEGFVARVDGDVFLAIVQREGSLDTDAVAQRVLDAVGDAGGDTPEDPRIASSIGVALSTFDGSETVPLFLQAELAMREAKALGGGQAFVFNQRLATSLRQRTALDAEIEQALANNEFTLFYQPQLAMESGTVVGLEALLRWEHPTRGLLLPGAFISIAFQRGLIDAMTKSVLGQVCEQIASWRRTGAVQEVPVTVNVSGKQFHDRRLPALVASALMKSGLPARLLVLEITEESLAAADAGIDRVVKELSRLGVRVALSDFNVGHASFRYQKQLQVSQVKIDRGFVKALPDDAETSIVVTALIDIAHRLGYQVVAEGVETREQFELLRSLGCDAGQGFYFGAPLSAIEIRAYLESKRTAPSR